MEDTNKEVSLQKQVARATRPVDLSGFAQISKNVDERCKEIQNLSRNMEELRSKINQICKPLDLSGFKLIVDRNTEEAKQRLNNQEYEEEPRKVR